ncbi:MAG: hypothetical protein HUJ86_03130 [Synergistes sp.]|nr:hypothetical protein [Synergistes sp.]
MKKIAAALMIILCTAAIAAAVPAKKGMIPGAEQLRYSGYKITQDGGINIVIRNLSDKTITFQAVISLLNNRHKEVGDTFIEKIDIPPNGDVHLKDLYLKGDIKECKKAESMRWTIYTLEEK